MTNETQFQTQADPKALAFLFEKDPEQLTQHDLDTIVVELRKQRMLFEQSEEAKALKPKAPKKKESTTKEEAMQMTLGDLGLDL